MATAAAAGARRNRNKQEEENEEYSDQGPNKVPYQVWVRQWYSSDKIQIVVAILIFFNFLIAAINSQLVPERGSAEAGFFFFFEVFFGVAFSLELLINMYGLFLCPFFASGWNLFDFVIVIISLLAIGLPTIPGVSILRLFRAFRVFRLFKRIPTLRMIIEGVVASMGAVGNAFILLIIIQGIWSIMGVEFYAEVQPQWFGTFWQAMLSLWQVMSMDSWSSQIARGIIFGNQFPLAATYFVSYLFIVGIIMANVVVAILLDKYLAQVEIVKKEIEEEKEAQADITNEEEEEEDTGVILETSLPKQLLQLDEEELRLLLIDMLKEDQLMEYAGDKEAEFTQLATRILNTDTARNSVYETIKRKAKEGRGDQRQVLESFDLDLTIISAKNVPAMDGDSMGGKCDPKIEVSAWNIYGRRVLGKTKMIPNTLEPVWNVSFSWREIRADKTITLKLYDVDLRLLKESIGGRLLQLSKYAPLEGAPSDIPAKDCECVLIPDITTDKKTTVQYKVKISNPIYQLKTMQKHLLSGVPFGDKHSLNGTYQQAVMLNGKFTYRQTDLNKNNSIWWYEDESISCWIAGIYNKEKQDDGYMYSTSKKNEAYMIQDKDKSPIYYRGKWSVWREEYEDWTDEKFQFSLTFCNVENENHLQYEENTNQYLPNVISAPVEENKEDKEGYLDEEKKICHLQNNSIVFEGLSEKQTHYDAMGVWRIHKKQTVGNGKNVYKHDKMHYYLWWYSTDNNTKGKWYLGTEDNIDKTICFICTCKNVEKDSPLNCGNWQGFYNHKWSVLPGLTVKKADIIKVGGLPNNESMGEYILDDEKINDQFAYRISNPDIDRYLWWHKDEQWMIGRKKQRGGNYCVMYTDTQNIVAGRLPTDWKGKWKILDDNKWKSTSSISCILQSADSTS